MSFNEYVLTCQSPKRRLLHGYELHLSKNLHHFIVKPSVRQR